jgi:hypothetical protein
MPEGCGWCTGLLLRLLLRLILRWGGWSVCTVLLNFREMLLLLVSTCLLVWPTSIGLVLCMIMAYSTVSLFIISSFLRVSGDLCSIVAY